MVHPTAHPQGLDRIARVAELGPKGPLGAAVDALLAALERFDEVALDLEVRRLGYLGPALSVVDGVIVPVLRTIGDRWFTGELSVAQEHLAAQKLGGVLRDLIRLAPGGDRPVIVACFADEQHDLGALATAVRLATLGFRPVVLGPRTPPDAVSRAVAALRPAAVALSVTLTPERERARELVSAYAAACGAVPWAVGGIGALPITDLVRSAGGYLAFPLDGRTRELDGFEQWLRRATTNITP